MDISENKYSFYGFLILYSCEIYDENESLGFGKFYSYTQTSTTENYKIIELLVLYKNSSVKLRIKK